MQVRHGDQAVYVTCGLRGCAIEETGEEYDELADAVRRAAQLVECQWITVDRGRL